MSLLPEDDLPRGSHYLFSPLITTTLNIDAAVLNVEYVS